MAFNFQLKITIILPFVASVNILPAVLTILSLKKLLL